MSASYFNDPSRNWHITAERITTSKTGTNLTLDASENVYIASGTGSTGSVYLNHNAWFDKNSNLNFSLGKGIYRNSIQTSSDNYTLELSDADLFKSFAFNPTANRIILMPPTNACKIGSWIEINNFSTTSSITIKDSTGTIVYTVLHSSVSVTVGGSGAKLLAVSSSGKTGEGFSDNWICSQSGVGATGSIGQTLSLIHASDLANEITEGSKLLLGDPSNNSV